MDKYLSAFLGFCSGLAVFLFGMRILSRSLEALSGIGKRTVDKSSGSPFNGFCLGVCASALMQSSSAATVTIVGLVNSGMLLLRAAYPIIIGANIGATAASWITALSEISSGTYIYFLSPQLVAPITAIVSVIIWLFAKKKRSRDISGILLGAAFLFIGMGIAGASFDTLADTAPARALLRFVSEPPFGVLVGILASATLQSSSASVGILQAMSINTVIPYSAVIPLVIGQNIGACASALISSVKGNRDAKSAALFHLYYNTAGALVSSLILYSAVSIKEPAFFSSDASSYGIAMTHTTFNIISAIVIAPFSKYIGLLCESSPFKKAELPSDMSSVEHKNAVSVDTGSEKLSAIIRSLSESADLCCSLLSTDTDENRASDNLSLQAALIDNLIDSTETSLRSTDTSPLERNAQIRRFALSELLHSLRSTSRELIDLGALLSSAQCKNASSETILSMKRLIDALHLLAHTTLKAQSDKDISAAHRILPQAEAIRSACDEIRIKGDPCGYSDHILTDAAVIISSICESYSTVALCILRSHLGGNAFEMREYLRQYAASPEFAAELRTIRNNCYI